MLDFILPILVFLSLAVIVFVLAKHYPQIKENEHKKSLEINKNSLKIKIFLKDFFSSGVSFLSKILLAVAEKIIKKTKELLHLFHFWVIKLKNKGKNKFQKKGENSDILDEIMAKEELIEAEEKNLEKIIHDDLGSSEEEEFILKNEKKEKVVTGDELKLEKNQEARKWVELAEEKVQNDHQEEGHKEDEKHNGNDQAVMDGFFSSKEVSGRKEKLAKFFKRKSDEKIILENEYDENEIENKGESFLEDKSGVVSEESGADFEERDGIIPEEKKGFMDKLRGSFGIFLEKISLNKKEKQKRENLQADEFLYEKKDEEEVFSDGIVKIGEFKKDEVDESLLIKEVVRVKNNIETDIDDEIGVDRQILEKKLINKIVKNPKQAENYRQLGELYIKMENYSEASDCYRQILKIKPRNIEARRKLEKIKLLRRIRK